MQMRATLLVTLALIAAVAEGLERGPSLAGVGAAPSEDTHPLAALALRRLSRQAANPGLPVQCSIFYWAVCLLGQLRQPPRLPPPHCAARSARALPKWRLEWQQRREARLQRIALARAPAAALPAPALAPALAPAPGPADSLRAEASNLR